MNPEVGFFHQNSRQWTRIMLTIRNLSFAIVLTFILTIYLKQIPEVEDKRSYNNNALIKNIVAYSLQKRLEMEREEVNECEGRRIEGDGRLIDDAKWNLLPDTDFYVFSAHQDHRLPYTYVRILGMAKGNWDEALFCTLDQGPVIKANRLDIWSENWIDDEEDQNFRPVLISCQLPVNLAYFKVYLSKKPCDIKRGLLVLSASKNLEQAVESRVGLCVKPLDFKQDITVRLVEWIEMNRILGAGTFTFYYKDGIHPDTKKLLDWYEKHDEIKILSYRDLQAPHSNIWQKRKNEILVYNHCFYSNLHKAEYIVPIDIDEIILPKISDSWQGIFTKFPKEYASYSIRNAYFFHNLNFTRVFRTFQRTVFSDADESGKSFVSTSRALTVFNHYALDVLRPGIGRCYFVPKILAQMNHYRQKCPQDLIPKCIKYLSSPRIFDDAVMKYKNVFNSRYRDLMRNFLHVK